jgi:ubiquinone/menaquinone biosynthesis C-methylase UbiE
MHEEEPMSSLMESKLTAEQHALIRKVLVAQTESVGRLELPIVAGLLRERGCRRVLDIGCGEGSFLLKLAARATRARFLGIDHNRLAIADARRRLREQGSRNVGLRTAFFDPSFPRAKYDAILTRYTLQHCSEPRRFVGAAFERLKKKGLLVSLESLDAYMDCHEKEPVWDRFRASVGAVHKRAGSDENTGKSLGGLLKAAGFEQIWVQVLLCSPSTVGYEAFRAVVEASAQTAASLFPDLFDTRLLRSVTRWLGDRARLERQDPYLCSAIACGTRP